MPSPSWPLLLAASLVVGCGPTFEAIQINRPPHALRARNPRTVKIFSSGPPSRPHVDVAVLTVEDQNGFGGGEDRMAMLQEMRSRGAELGCDGIVLGGRTNRRGADPGSGWDLVDSGSSSWQGTCIVYEDDEPVTETLRRQDQADVEP